MKTTNTGASVPGARFAILTGRRTVQVYDPQYRPIAPRPADGTPGPPGAVAVSEAVTAARTPCGASGASVASGAAGAALQTLGTIARNASRDACVFQATAVPAEPFAAESFPQLLAVADPARRLWLLQCGAARFAQQQRAQVLVIAGGHRRLFAALGLPLHALENALPASGATVAPPPAHEGAPQPAGVAEAEAEAVAEVELLYADLLGVSSQPMSARARDCYLRHYTLIQLLSLSLPDRLRLQQRVNAVTLRRWLGIDAEDGGDDFGRRLQQALQGRPECLPHAVLPQTAAGVPGGAAQQRWWQDVRACLQALSPSGGTGRNRIRRSTRVRQPLALRSDRVGALARQNEASAVTAGRTPEQDRCHFRAALLLLKDARYGADMLQLRRVLPSWNAVADALHLSRALDQVRMSSDLSRHMSGDPLLQRHQRAEAAVEVRRRQQDPASALADRSAHETLVQRLRTLIGSLRQVSPGQAQLHAQWAEDFVQAADDLGTQTREAIMRRLGAAGLASALHMPSPESVTSVLLQSGHWRKSQQARIQRLRGEQAAGVVARPQRVGQLRAGLEILAAHAGHAPATAQGQAAPAASPVAGASSAVGESKPAPDIVFEPQRLDPLVVARRPDGGDWLDGLDTLGARLIDASWQHFERTELRPGGVPPASWQALRERIEGRLAALLRPDPRAIDACAPVFELVTTLDDGHERGMGVTTRWPLARFEPLFFYGGTVCVGDEAALAWRLRHPQAWRYALGVGFGLAEPNFPDATSFGYPEGNLGPRINARQLLGTDGQRRRAANVALLSVRLPGLPFGLPLMVTREALSAGDELFLDYGRDFCRFVDQSLAGLPRWPTVKPEPRSGEVETLASWRTRYLALPQPPGGAAPAPEARPLTAPAGTRPDAALPPGWTLRPPPTGPDSLFHALEGRVLDAALLQQLRHDLADLMARQPDTADTLRRHGEAAGRALGLPARPVPHALYADLVRQPQQAGGAIEIAAWCRLQDERQRARSGARVRRPRPAQVAVLTQDGRLRLHSASGSRAAGLQRLDAAARAARIDQLLRAADVALIQLGGQFAEVLQSALPEPQGGEVARSESGKVSPL